MFVASGLLVVSAKPGSSYQSASIRQDSVDCEQDSLRVAEPIVAMSPAPVMRGDIVSVTPEPILQTADIEPGRIYATAPVAPPAMEVKLAPEPTLKVARPLAVSTQTMHRIDHAAPTMWQSRLESSPVPIAHNEYVSVAPEPILRTAEMEPARIYATASVAPPVLEVKPAIKPLLKVARPLAPAPIAIQTVKYLDAAPIVETRSTSTVVHDAPAAKIISPFAYGLPLMPASSFQSFSRGWSANKLIAAPQLYSSAAVVADLPKYYYAAPAAVAAPVLQQKYTAVHAPAMAPLPKFYAQQYYSPGPKYVTAEYRAQPIVSEVVAQEPCEK